MLRVAQLSDHLRDMLVQLIVSKYSFFSQITLKPSISLIFQVVGDKLFTGSFDGTLRVFDASNLLHDKKSNEKKKDIEKSFSPENENEMIDPMNGHQNYEVIQVKEKEF